jgi:hypothetical protein
MVIFLTICLKKGGFPGVYPLKTSKKQRTDVCRFLDTGQVQIKLEGERAPACCVFYSVH